MFKCKNELDERQQKQRGDVFQHGIVLFFVLLFANAMLKECDITWAEGMQEDLLIIWIVIAQCLGEFAILEIYPIGGGMNVIYIADGLCGTVLFTLCLKEILTGEEMFAVGHTLTRTGSQMIQGALMLLLLLVFLGKKVYNRRKEAQEDEA